MSDFQSFRDAVLEDEDLQEQVISIVNTATTNGSGMGDGEMPPFFGHLAVRFSSFHVVQNTPFPA